MSRCLLCPSGEESCDMLSLECHPNVPFPHRIEIQLPQQSSNNWEPGAIPKQLSLCSQAALMLSDTVSIRMHCKIKSRKLELEVNLLASHFFFFNFCGIFFGVNFKSSLNILAFLSLFLPIPVIVHQGTFSNIHITFLFYNFLPHYSHLC